MMTDVESSSRTSYSVLCTSPDATKVVFASVLLNATPFLLGDDGFFFDVGDMADFVGDIIVVVAVSSRSIGEPVIPPIVLEDIGRISSKAIDAEVSIKDSRFSVQPLTSATSGSDVFDSSSAMPARRRRRSRDADGVPILISNSEGL